MDTDNSVGTVAGTVWVDVEEGMGRINGNGKKYNTNKVFFQKEQPHCFSVPY